MNSTVSSLRDLPSVSSKSNRTQTGSLIDKNQNGFTGNHNYFRKSFYLAKLNFYLLFASFLSRSWYRDYADLLISTIISYNLCLRFISIFRECTRNAKSYKFNRDNINVIIWKSYSASNQKCKFKSIQRIFKIKSISSEVGTLFKEI